MLFFWLVGLFVLFCCFSRICFFSRNYILLHKSICFLGVCLGYM